MSENVQPPRRPPFFSVPVRFFYIKQNVCHVFSWHSCPFFGWPPLIGVMFFHDPPNSTGPLTLYKMTGPYYKAKKITQDTRKSLIFYSSLASKLRDFFFFTRRTKILPLKNQSGTCPSAPPVEKMEYCIPIYRTVGSYPLVIIFSPGKLSGLRKNLPSGHIRT
jgi:hypothetical protein